MVVTILVIVGIVGIGVGILAYRGRTEKGIESGITSFRRELHALAPRPDVNQPSSGPERPADEARGMKIMPSETDAAPETEAEAETETEIGTETEAEPPVDRPDA